jgi:hypothetical protein
VTFCAPVVTSKVKHIGYSTVRLIASSLTPECFETIRVSADRRMDTIGESYRQNGVFRPRHCHKVTIARKRAVDRHSIPAAPRYALDRGNEHLVNTTNCSLI